jgi:thiol-disulfide isomerase/thioredoxin
MNRINNGFGNVSYFSTSKDGLKYNCNALFHWVFLIIIKHISTKHPLKMNKAILFTAIVLLIGAEVFSQAINVPKRKKALLMKMTATWCGPCGYYHAITEDIYQKHGDSIVFINAHVSSSDVGDAYSGNFHNELNGAGEGIPGYNVNGIKQPSWPPLEKAMLDSARKFLKKPVIANIAFKYQINGSQLSVQTSVKFFAADNADEYFVNVFILENKISTKQKVDATYQTMIQDRVSRGPVMSGNAGIWGEKIATGSIASGKFYDVNFTAALNSIWIKNNLQLVAVLWKKKGSVYNVLSAEDIPAIATDIADSNTNNSNEIITYPNPVVDKMNITVNGTGSIAILNTLGQMVLYNDFSTNANQEVSVNTTELKPGVYFLKVIRDGKISTQKIIIQSAEF